MVNIQIELGRGGYKRVFKESESSTDVAAAYPLDSSCKFELHNEFSKLIILDDPHIPRVVSFKQGRLATELAPLDSLDDFIDKYGPGSDEAKAPKDYFAEILKSMDDVIKALQHAKSRGVYAHCDVKPKNIMVEHDEGNILYSMLIDWQSARLEKDKRRKGDNIGSLAFAAPELVILGTVTPSTDVYSLGMIFAYAFAKEELFCDNVGFNPDQEEFCKLHNKYNDRARSELYKLTAVFQENYGLGGTMFKVGYNAISLNPKDRPSLDQMESEVKLGLMKINGLN